VNYLGIEIGGTKLQLVVGDEQTVRTRQRFAVDRSKGAIGIRQQIEMAVGDLMSGANPAAIGVGFGGPVDWKTGRICRSHQIEGWSEFALGEWLQELSGKPVRIDNDANMAALGESMRGAGIGFNPVFYVTLGSGVGGGLVVDGKIYHGAMPGEAEIGHVRLDQQGTTVESRCSGWAVDAKIRRLKTSGSPSVLAALIGDSIGGEAKHLPAALREKDKSAQLILDETARDLAFGLSHVVRFIPSSSWWAADCRSLVNFCERLSPKHCLNLPWKLSAAGQKSAWPRSAKTRCRWAASSPPGRFAVRVKKLRVLALIAGFTLNGQGASLSTGDTTSPARAGRGNRQGREAPNG
jgi:glucokinase